MPRIGDPPPIAAEQAGVFSVAQAVSHGLTMRQVRYRLSRRHWHRVIGRGLSASAAPHTWTARVWAASLTFPGTVVSHRSAATLLGWPVPPADTIHLSGRRTARRRAGVHVHLRRVPPADVQLLDGGLLVTNGRRTAIDTLMAMSPAAAESLWPWLATREVVTRRDLQHAVRLRFGSPGVSTLLHLARIARTGAVNGGEQRFIGC
jgi:hypothetical protein